MELLVNVKTVNEDYELNVEEAGIAMEYLLPYSLYNCCVSASDTGKAFFSYCEKLPQVDSVSSLLAFFFEENPNNFSEEKIEELNDELDDEEYVEAVVDELRSFYNHINEINNYSDIRIIIIESSDELDDPYKSNQFRVTFTTDDKTLNLEEHYYIDDEETTAEEYSECY